MVRADDLLERFFEGESPGFPFAGEWVPGLDLSETKDAVVVKAEVPGMDPKDIQVTLQEGAATFKNGVLAVTMPKAASAKGTTIPIETR